MTERTPIVADPKPFWKSKTFWTFSIMAVALIIQEFTGYLVSDRLQLVALIVVGIVLRIVTKQPIEFNLREEYSTVTAGNTGKHLSGTIEKKLVGGAQPPPDPQPSPPATGCQCVCAKKAGGEEE